MTATTTPEAPPLRPKSLQDKLAAKEPIYYVGIGSNMLRSKVENRGQKKIGIISMEPVIIPKYRLAFNMMALPPAEPVMAGIEPIPNVETYVASRRSYSKPEAHGSLIQVSAEDYESLAQSEGIRQKPDQGYEEIVVQAYTYKNPNKCIDAICLRVRDHVKIPNEEQACPSLRYITLLRDGAAELQLDPSYQEFLNQHPADETPPFLNKMGKYSVALMFSLMMKFQSNPIIKFYRHAQKKFLWFVYVPSTGSQILRYGSFFVSGLMMLPSAAVCFIGYHLLDLTGNAPVLMKKFLAM